MKARCFLFVTLWDCEIGRFLFFFSYHCFFACLCVAAVTWMLVDKKALFEFITPTLWLVGICTRNTVLGNHRGSHLLAMFFGHQICHLLRYYSMSVTH